MAAPGILILGAIAQGGGNPPAGSKGETPVEGLADEVPKKLKQFALFTYFECTAETIKISKFCTIHLLILDQYVSRCGGKRGFGG